mmetsp:Transcript_16726/g.58489  ORF Transcript_16726/g.58489 Transcript_16726/m.58489 type:complete len:209 (+) Transcript_16726:784-1410(+)
MSGTTRRLVPVTTVAMQAHGMQRLLAMRVRRLHPARRPRHCQLTATAASRLPSLSRLRSRRLMTTPQPAAALSQLLRINPNGLPQKLLTARNRPLLTMPPPTQVREPLQATRPTAATSLTTSIIPSLRSTTTTALAWTPDAAVWLGARSQVSTRIRQTALEGTHRGARGAACTWIRRNRCWKRCGRTRNRRSTSGQLTKSRRRAWMRR